MYTQQETSNTGLADFHRVNLVLVLPLGPPRVSRPAVSEDISLLAPLSSPHDPRQWPDPAGNILGMRGTRPQTWSAKYIEGNTQVYSIQIQPDGFLEVH